VWRENKRTVRGEDRPEKGQERTVRKWYKRTVREVVNRPARAEDKRAKRIPENYKWLDETQEDRE
jgi:hypothetical protein